MRILTVNAGSSSLRLAAFDHSSHAVHALSSAHYPTQNDSPADLLGQFVSAHAVSSVQAVVHRIVHGGARFTSACLIDAAVEAQIAELIPLAPLHNAMALDYLQQCREQFGSEIPHIAVFDTAFYHDLPPVAAHYALPADLVAQHGLRRYGFHGLAHQALWQSWLALHPQQASPRRVITLQLGSGCSITALHDGKPIDTSMGFTPLEGLVMATRCGDLDAGLLLHLQRRLGLAAAELEELLNRRSGLLGVSGLSADMRVLLNSDSAEAQLAVALYCYRARKYIGAYMAALGGVDSIVFGGGVGEHAAPIRAQILADMEWAGIQIDQETNSRVHGTQQRISQPDSRVSVWVLPVDEQRLMAEQAYLLLNSGP